jgi:hypothetical protein
MKNHSNIDKHISRNYTVLDTEWIIGGILSV